MGVEALFDVIVVGCGPVGAAAANLLGAHGISTLVIERETTPYELPRAIHFDAEIMRVLQSAGLAEWLLPSLSTPAASVHIGADGGVIRRLAMGGRTRRMGWAADYMFYQPEFEALLRERLAQYPHVSLRLGWTLTDVRQSGEGVEATVIDADEKTRSVRGRFLLACDGATSRVRKAMQITLDDLGFEEPWVVIDAEVEGAISLPPEIRAPADLDLEHTSLMVCQPRRPATVIPGRGRHRRWEFMLLPGESDDEMRRTERIQALLAPWIVHAQCRVLRAAVYRFHGLIAQRWQDGRVFLLGDAAHQSPPFYGQGLCHGIRDVANLAWKLELVLKGQAGAALLESYQPERAPQVRKAIEASIEAGRYICTLDPEAARRRDERMRAALQDSAGEVFFEVAPIETGVVRPTGGPGVGAAFIQPRVRLDDGREWLLDDATGGGFVLLSRSPRPLDGVAEDLLAFWSRLEGIAAYVDEGSARAVAAGTVRLIDVSGELGIWLEQHGAVGLILRPDGYVFTTIGAGDSIERALHSLRSALAWRDRGRRDRGGEAFDRMSGERS